MRRSRIQKNTAAVSLFPFLAVLVCTMGVLIVLLVVVVQQARAHAESVAKARAAEKEQQAAAQRETQQEKRLALEDYDWQVELLSEQRDEIRETLAEKRKRLSHLEDHARRLQEELSRAVEAAGQLQDVENSRDLDLAALREQAAGAQRAVEQAKQDLAAAKSRVAEKPRSFSLLPYVGPNGTKRRPIYLECLPDRVVFQPEGVALVARDFEGPLGPGNPLDAALRAVREHWAAHGSVREHGEPYPLLVVRPGGAVSYSAARAAMKSWDDEFGYELIDEGMQLAYPPADPTLRKRLEQTLAEARRRQELMRAARPSLYGEDHVNGFRVRRRGGLEPLSEVEEDRGRFGFGGGAGSWGHGGDSSEQATGQQAARRGQPGATANSPQPGQAPAPFGAPQGQQGGQSDQATPPGSLAQERGSNWGLPNAARGATGFTRPIRVQCLPDRLVIWPEPGSGGRPQQVRFEGPTRRSIDSMVSLLWKRIESWGIAGPRAYWKPLLSVEVAPGAVGRYRDLELLLEDSGIELERKSP